MFCDTFIVPLCCGGVLLHTPIFRFLYLDSLVFFLLYYPDKEYGV